MAAWSGRVQPNAIPSGLVARSTDSSCGSKSIPSHHATHYPTTTSSTISKSLSYPLIEFSMSYFSSKTYIREKCTADLKHCPLHVPPRSTRSKQVFAELPKRAKTVEEGFLRRMSLSNLRSL